MASLTADTSIVLIMSIICNIYIYSDAGGYFQCNRFQSSGNGGEELLEGREDHQEEDDEIEETVLGKSATDAYFAMFPDEGR